MGKKAPPKRAAGKKKPAGKKTPAQKRRTRKRKTPTKPVVATPGATVDSDDDDEEIHVTPPTRPKKARTSPSCATGLTIDPSDPTRDAESVAKATTLAAMSDDELEDPDDISVVQKELSEAIRAPVPHKDGPTEDETNAAKVRFPIDGDKDVQFRQNCGKLD